MKTKLTITLLAVSMLIIFLCGCQGSGQSSSLSSAGTVSSALSDDRTASSDNEKPSVVCTTYPQYNWVQNILGDQLSNVNLTLLLDNGIDLHSYQPSAEDIIKISEADLFIYVGGESDAWVKDALNASKKSGTVSLNMMEALAAEDKKEEESVEGMQKDGHDREDDAEEEAEYDEHIWLSLENAEKLCTSIQAALAQLDPAHTDTYQANCQSYISQLDALDNEYEQALEERDMRKVILFADRFPFRYLTDDYDLTYYAAFAGCSAETEASFETVTFLSGKIEEESLPCVLVTETSDKKLANTIIQNTKSKDQQILVLNSMQSVTNKDIENGADYLSLMKSNLDVLKKALNQE